MYNQASLETNFKIFYDEIEATEYIWRLTEND